MSKTKQKSPSKPAGPAITKEYQRLLLVGAALGLAIVGVQYIVGLFTVPLYTSSGASLQSAITASFAGTIVTLVALIIIARIVFVRLGLRRPGSTAIAAIFNTYMLSGLLFVAVKSAGPSALIIRTLIFMLAGSAVTLFVVRLLARIKDEDRAAFAAFVLIILVPFGLYWLSYLLQLNRSVFIGY